LYFSDVFAAEKNVFASQTQKIFSVKLSDVVQRSFFLVLLLAFVFGIVSSLTPCVYPLIPITVSIIGSQALGNKFRGFKLSIVFVFGLSIFYTVFGLIAARSGTIFGNLLQSKVNILIVVAILFAMGLSLLGLFEIKLPYFISKRLPKNTEQKGYIGIFLAGFITGIVAIPCIGPFAVSVLAFAALTTLLKGFILLFSFSLGIGVLFIFVGTFSAILVNLPKPGNWMILLKKIFGLILLVVGFYYLKITVPVWLFLSVMGACFFLLSWVFKKQRDLTTNLKNFHDSIRRISKIAGIIVATSLFLFLYLSPLFYVENRTKANSLIPWLAAENLVLEQAKNKGKPIIIDFYADWCPGCKDYDKYTFTDEEVVRKMKEFIPLKVDLTSSTRENSRIYKKYSVRGLPTIVFLDSLGNEIKSLRAVGYTRARNFVKLMDRALEIESKE